MKKVGFLGIDYQVDFMDLPNSALPVAGANSLRQLCDEVPALLPKLVILEDGMSDVPGLPAPFYVGVQAIYDRAKSLGAQFAKTTDFTTSI